MDDGSLLAHFQEMPDPRMVNKCSHRFIDILMIAICATLADADGWEEIALFGQSKQAWLKQWLALPNGIPSPDTFKRVFEHLDAEAFQLRFVGWVSDVFRLTDGQVIAIDGKAVRGTYDASGQGGLHLVSAWATANSVTLAQVAVADKANEIVAIPTLLELLALRGCIVTLDALGCQKSIVQAIRAQAADYVVTVKGNQPTLHTHLQQAFASADARPETDWGATGHCQTVNHGHGRTETRDCWVLADSHAAALGWRDCQTLVRIRRTCQRGAARPSVETHYYITSLPAQASLVLNAVRAHWGIENGCHWILDVVFHEDACRVRSQNGDRNLALLRKIALNLLRHHPAKGSLKGKRYRAALDEDFLLAVLHSSFNLMR